MVSRMRSKFYNNAYMSFSKTFYSESGVGSMSSLSLIGPSVLYTSIYSNMDLSNFTTTSVVSS